MNNLTAIRDYMLLVRRHCSEQSEPPDDYRPDDRDGGYRSALRHYKIQRSSKTDTIASAVIYRRKLDPSVFRCDDVSQRELF